MGGPFWKPSYREERRVKLATLLAERKKLRMRVMARDDFRCRSCRRRPTPWTALEVHEEPPRSQGGDPLNEKECISLCHECHKKRTLNEMSLTIQDLEQGTGGPVEFETEERVWVTSGLRGRDEA